MRKRSEATQKTIITAARRLFLSQGYVGTTLDAVAEQAGVTKRTVYGYFPDKRALFKGVIEDAVGDPWEFQVPLEGVATVEGLHSALYAIGQGINEILYQPDYIQLLRVVITEVPSQPDLSILFERGAIRRALRTVTGLLRTAEMHGMLSLKDTEAAAQQFVGGFAVRVFLDGLLQPSPQHARKLTNVELADYVDDFMWRAARPPTSSES